MNTSQPNVITRVANVDAAEKATNAEALRAGEGDAEATVEKPDPEVERTNALTLLAHDLPRETVAAQLGISVEQVAAYAEDDEADKFRERRATLLKAAEDRDRAAAEAASRRRVGGSAQVTQK
jgi:hypothetical protein